MKRVAILGGSGFLGTQLCASMAANGVALVIPSRNPVHAGSVKVLPGAKVPKVDYGRPDELAQAIAGCDALINLVGVLNASGKDGAGFRRAHAGVTQSAIEACHQAGVQRFVQISAINAGKGESWYLKTKGEAEDLLRASDLDWTILRPSVIFGPGDGFFNRFAGLLKLMPMGMPLGCAQARLQPVFLNDVVEAIEACLDNPDSVGQTYELAGPEADSLLNLVRFTATTLGMKRPVFGVPAPIGWMQAAACELIPGKPFSIDNYKSLKLDNVSDSQGLQALGITPRHYQPIVRQYLAGTSSHQRRLSRHRQVARR